MEGRENNLSIGQTMSTDNLLVKLHASQKSILTTQDIALLWGETNAANLNNKIKYYAKRGSIAHLSRGIFAKSTEYDVKELATSIYTPSYISFETVLREAGVIFQHHSAVFVAGPYSIQKKIDGHDIRFRKLKDSVLYNDRGVQHNGRYSQAQPERALLDMLYVHPTFHLDNPHAIDWDVCAELAPIYGNKQLINRIKTYQTHAQ